MTNINMNIYEIDSILKSVQVQNLFNKLNKLIYLINV
jgi:hypothetical protein